MWKLKSGEEVIDRLDSHLHAGAAPLLPEALSRISSRGRSFINDEAYFGRVIGETICVATGPSDEIIYAIRPNRVGHSRFVRNRKPAECASLTVVLKKAAEGGYILMTAFIGGRAELEPWDKNATAESRAFWDSHALIWGSEPIVPGTETAQCPWPVQEMVSNGRPLPELEMRVMRPLSCASQEVRERCVEIARAKSPSAAFEMGRLAALADGSLTRVFGWDTEVAKATRWLAVIRRDYGMEKFNQAVGTLTAAATPKP